MLPRTKRSHKLMKARQIDFALRYAENANAAKVIKHKLKDIVKDIA